MANTARLKVCGRVDLDGTHRAIIESSTIRVEPPAGGGGGGAPFLELGSGTKRCGCILAELVESDAERILIDRFKLWQLELKDGDEVEVTPLDPPAATEVTLSAPADFTERDAIRFIGKPLVAGERTALFSFSGETRLVTVTAVAPQEIAMVTPTTRIELGSTGAEPPPITYNDIGGLEREIKQIREMIEYPLRFVEMFKHLGVSAPRGIILHGPPGTGKTLIARALAGEVGARFYSISGPEVYSKWYGKSEETLRNIFEEAVKNSPSIVVIDELDSLVPRREATHGDQEQRIVATFLTQMDGLGDLKDVVVVGTTNRLDAIDSALRRGGRFEHEIPIGVPDAAGREAILEIHTRRMPLAADVELAAIAGRTMGFVGADLASLCREAAYNALRRTFSAAELAAGSLPSHAGLTVSQQDFLEAVRAIPPSASKEFAAEVPAVPWSAIGGLEEAKQLLIENISYAISKREVFERVGLRPASGILLHGPPGTGKTLLARAVARECGANFISVRGPELRFKWIGESEQQVRQLFARARQLAPCVLFFDEIDAAVQRRGRDLTGVTDSIVNQLLAELDGIGADERVFVIGATNRIEALDPAVLRPGRFDYHIETPLPDRAARRAIFEIQLADKPCGDDVDLEHLARESAGLSGAAIAEVCRDATLAALRDAGFDDHRVTIGAKHLARGLERVLRLGADRATDTEGERR